MTGPEQTAAPGSAAGTSRTIALLPGDGIGAEVIPQAVRVLEAAAAACGQRIAFEGWPAGGLSIDAHGTPITEEAVEACMGMIPSAALGDGQPCLFEPIHGSAPDIAGQGTANPLGAILTTAMLLEHGLGLPAGAARIRAAVEAALEAGCRTRDLVDAGQEHASTAEMTDEVLARL